MLVAPVCIVSHSVLDKFANQRKHVGVTNAGNESVDSCLTEVNIVFFFLLSSETLLGSHPVGINILIDVNHELEDRLKNVLDQSFVFLCKGWLSLDNSDNKFHGLMSDGIVGEVFVSHDGLERLIKGLEVSSEEVRLNLRQLVELDHSILKSCLVLFLESLGDNANHKG